jgi:hypothetical protein
MPRPRFTLRKILIVTALVAIVFGSVPFLQTALGPIRPDDVIAQLRPGMGEAEIETILGRPDEVDDYGKWVYEKPFNPGWLGIIFDEHRKLLYHDHEPVFP